VIGVSLIISSLILGNSVYNGLSEVQISAWSSESKALSFEEKIQLNDAWVKFNNERTKFDWELVKFESPVSKEDIAFIKEGRPVKWDKNAKISWLEFSDFKCGFCQRQHNNKTYEQVKAKYSDNELNFVYIPFTIFDAPWAAAAECVFKEAWEKTFYNTITDVYKIKDSSIPTILEIAERHGADSEKVKSCFTNLETLETIKKTNQIAAEGFQISWTPGNILINNETGEFKFISWAYPVAEFEKNINELLGK
jgi:protein-disulfide isomerase